MKRPRKRTPPRRARKNADEYAIGYGKPPRANQFKPGQSGNPKGRPKGVKNEDTLMRELLQQKIGLNERGRSRKITIHEAILRRIVEDCLKGNTKSAAFLLNRYQAQNLDEPIGSGFNEDDETVLQTYLQKYQSKLNQNEDES